MDKGTIYLKLVSPYDTLDFPQAHKIPLSPQWRENRYRSRKSHILAQIQRPIISYFATRLEVRSIYACAPRRVLSEYTSHTPGSFLEYDHSHM